MRDIRFQKGAACVALALAMAGAMVMAGCEQDQTSQGRPTHPPAIKLVPREPAPPPAKPQPQPNSAERKPQGA